MGLPKELDSYDIFGLDTSIFIYHLEAHPTYLPYTQQIFASILSGQKRAVTSTISLVEINVQPLQLGREDIARKYEALLVNFPYLRIADIDRRVARQAARLRAAYQVHPADALQIAACQLHGAQVFITNDKRLSSLKLPLAIAILDRWV